MGNLGGCRNIGDFAGYCSVDILGHLVGLVGSPDETAAEEGKNESKSVVELPLGAGQTELVKEPVDVEEDRRKLPKNEGGAVVVDKGTL